jgi:hypothetical protein
MSSNRKVPSVRPITRGPKHHWFGYYDKLQFDPTGRYVLGMEVSFEGRSPNPGDIIGLGMVDLADNDRWIGLGETRAWCWQQGCMLQWLPGSSSEVIWNDRDGDDFVSRVLDVHSGQFRTLSHPVYALAPDGKTAIGLDFGRLEHMRPGYGYAGVPDPNRDVGAPTDSSIDALDLVTGESRNLFTVEEVAMIPWSHGDIVGARHYFNQLLVNPNGSRFVFLHRWWPMGHGFRTRMMSAALDGSDLRVVEDYGQMSHFFWRDPETILAWAYQPSYGNAYYLFKDTGDCNASKVIGLGVMILNGHCSYLPGNEWILNDTYAHQTDGRQQEMYLYHVPSNEIVPLGAFHAPDTYDGALRCDLHPRFSPDGKKVVFDSSHGGAGRQMYLLELDSIVN